MRVTVCDAKRSDGRKFLVAGKSGLNLTHGEPLAAFAKRYECGSEPAVSWRELLEETGPDDVQAVCAGTRWMLR